MLTNNFWETITPSILIEKATGYLPIPAFGILNFTSAGAPFIVQQIIYQSPNNFCIPEIPLYATIGANFNFAIRYNDPLTGVPVRYKLWNLADDSFNDIPAPLYTGQMILGGNFALEIWSLGANNSLYLPFGILLATSVKKALQSLTDPTTFQLATLQVCSSLQSTNGLNMPLTFLPCATATYNGQLSYGVVGVTGLSVPASLPSVGSNYQFNPTTGQLELLNVTTGLHNPIVTQGTAGTESIVIEPQD